MALTATVHRLRIALSDVDRGVYESLDLRLARHPSETLRALVARSLAYALYFEDGIAFTQGLASADDPAIWVRDPTGILKVWIDLGSPSPQRLHRASKAAGRVIVVCHNDPTHFLREARAATIHRAADVEVISLTPSLLDVLESSLERSSSWEVTRTDDLLYLTIDGKVHEGAITRHSLVAEPVDSKPTRR
jgi:uncharacterized protein YaeQ